MTLIEELKYAAGLLEADEEPQKEELWKRELKRKLKQRKRDAETTERKAKYGNDPQESPRPANIKKATGPGFEAEATKRDLEAANKLIKQASEVEAKLKDKSFTAQDGIELGLEISTRFTAFDELVDKKDFARKAKKAMKEKDEGLKLREAKKLAFEAILLINKGKESLSSKKDNAAVKTIKTEKGPEILKSTKGEHNDDAKTKSVREALNKASVETKLELGNVDKNAETPIRAKIFAGQIAKDYIDNQYEGTKKADQMTAEFLALKKQQKDIEERSKDENDKEAVEKWQKLNVLQIMNDLQEFSKGRNNMTVDQVKAAIKKLKNANIEGLDLVDEYLTKRKK